MHYTTFTILITFDRCKITSFSKGLAVFRYVSNYNKCNTMINEANFIIIVPIGGRGVELGTGVEVPVFQVEK